MKLAFSTQIPDYRNAVIVAKTPASAKKAQSYAERLRLGIAVIHGEPQDFDSDREDGRHSPPPQNGDGLSFTAGEGFKSQNTLGNAIFFNILSNHLVATGITVFSETLSILFTNNVHAESITCFLL